MPAPKVRRPTPFSVKVSVPAKPVVKQGGARQFVNRNGTKRAQGNIVTPRPK
jgi:hypothetical protein